MIRKCLLWRSLFIVKNTNTWCHFKRSTTSSLTVSRKTPTNRLQVLTSPGWETLKRYYAKGKDKKKEVKGKKIVVNENELAQVLNVEQLFTKLNNPLEHMKDEFVNKLSLRTAAGALDELKVTHEGTDYALQDLAQISKKNPKTIVVNMVNFPQVIPDVLKAIANSGLGLNPQQDGTTLFIAVPKVTKEHRETLAKSAKAMFIKCRDTVRDVQNQTIKTIKAKEGISEDMVYSIKDQIVYLADKKIQEAEATMKTKQDELVKTEL